jgi:hypothetical protein
MDTQSCQKVGAGKGSKEQNGIDCKNKQKWKRMQGGGEEQTATVMSLKTNPSNERRAKNKTRKSEESKEREERGKQTHQPIHLPILRKYLIEPRYRCQENNSIHCENTYISTCA